MIILTLLIAVAAAILLLPTLSDLISLARLHRASPRTTDDGASRLPSFLFLIPAHNEELLIDTCLRSVRALTYPPELIEIIVIADNCVDGTAEVVRAAGLRCLERTDIVRRGKPWALAWAIDQLPLHRYDGVVIVDADAVVAPDFATQLARAAPLARKALQPFNGVSNRSEHALTRLGALFAVSRFCFINALKQRVGLNVPLANGLCIGTALLIEHGWQAFSICEDWELYTILTEHGIRVENVPDARILSQEARSLRQSSSQRTRWTAGRIAVLRQHLSALLQSPHVRWHQKLDCIAELTAPGPVAHVALVIVIVLLTFLLHPPGALWLALALLASIVRHIVYALAALRVDPEPGSAIAAFAYLPVYAVWRLGIQLLSVATFGGRLWVRTERHVESVASPGSHSLSDGGPGVIRTGSTGMETRQNQP